MPFISLPPQDSKRWAKAPEGEVFGNIIVTKNIDLLDNYGKVKLSRRTFRIFDDGDDADFEVPVAAIQTNADGTDRWWVLTQSNTTSTSDGLMFKSTNTQPDSSWAQDAIASSPTDCVDNMVIFGEATTDRLYVARDTDIAELENGAWVADWWTNASHQNQSALTSSNPHPIHKFLNLLLIPDGNVVHTSDDSEVVTINRLQLPTDQSIVWIKDDGIRVFFGCRHTRGGQGLVFPWDGTSETHDEPLEVFGSRSFSGVSKNGIMHTINDIGQLLAFNGSAFEEIDHLPIKDTSLLWEDDLAAPFNRVIHPNGMAIIDGDIHVLINGAIAGTVQDNYERMPSGIWRYNEKTGFHNRYALGQFDGTTDVDWGAPSISRVGMIIETNKRDGRFLAGARVWTQSATELNALIGDQNSATNRGYFITSELSASSALELWQRVHLLFRPFETSTDRIVVKYRVTKDANFENISPSNQRCNITWSSTTVFTCTASTFNNAAIGDEVEILQGKGAGALAHISAISLGGTDTITLDEAIPNVVNTDTADARVQNWIKLGTISDTAIQKKLFTIVKRATFIQFKVELRGDSVTPEIQKLLAEFKRSNR